MNHVPPATRMPGRRAASVAYGCLMRLLLPLVLLRYLWRGRREPGYRTALAERWGGGRAPDGTGRLWIHAVSLGETRAAAALAVALRARHPGLRILWTHGTATGRAAGAALLQPGDAQAWLPWDSPGAVRRFLARHRPVAGVVMETEVWPALMQAAARQGLPMLLANARLSERSLRRGRRLEVLLRPAAEAFTRVLAQSDDDARRLREMGARDVVVCGNLKYDMTMPAAQRAAGQAWRERLGRPVVLAVSTREGEEAPLFDAWAGAVGGGADVARDGAGDPAGDGAAAVARAGAAGHGPPLLLVVPRHPQRFDEVADLAAARGWRVARRGGWADDAAAPRASTAASAPAANADTAARPEDRAFPLPPAEALQADVWIGDSLGELALYYALADVALLGGSYAPLGGHNLIEAAACGCPLLIGPSTFNFAEAAALALAAGAATRADDLPDAVARALDLLDDTARREAQARRALAFAAAHRGAADAQAREILATAGPAVAP